MNKGTAWLKTTFKLWILRMYSNIVIALTLTLNYIYNIVRLVSELIL